VNEFDSQLTLADLRAATGAVARAAEEYEALGREQPDRPEIALSLGYLDLARKDKAAARQEFEKAYAEGINDARMLFQLAALEREEKASASKVIPILERAVALRPGFTDAAVNLGLLRLEIRDYQRTLELLTKVDTINPSSAPAVYTALAYANLQTGHLDEARRDAAVVRKYAKEPGQTNAVTGIEGLIDARAKSKFPPQPGEKLQQAEGLAQSIECGATGSKLTILIAGQVKLFELPEPKAVEFNRPQGAAAQLSCSIREPFPIVVEFASPNIVRRLQF
jgi:tetratricopeptide (TPR) repeat protein